MEELKIAFHRSLSSNILEKHLVLSHFSSSSYYFLNRIDYLTFLWMMSFREEVCCSWTLRLIEKIFLTLKVCAHRRTRIFWSLDFSWGAWILIKSRGTESVVFSSLWSIWGIILLDLRSIEILCFVTWQFTKPIRTCWPLDTQKSLFRMNMAQRTDCYRWGEMNYNNCNYNNCQHYMFTELWITKE